MPKRAKRVGADALPGRPRSPAIDQAVLRSAFSLFIERGLAGVSIERIAARAGVARTSIYRRWASRDALLAEAIEAGRNQLAARYTADAIRRAAPPDFVQLLLGVGELMARPEVKTLVTRLIGTIPDNPHLVEVYRDTYFMPRRRALLEALRHVQAAGALSDAVNLDIIADMLAGALIYRLIFDVGTSGTADDVSGYVLSLIGALGFDLATLRLPSGRQL